MSTVARLSIEVNGESYDLDIPPNRTLLQLIREDLELVGTKDACRQGVCGSCTVLVDGLPIRSCLALAMRYQHKEITTIEGLNREAVGGRLQQEFINSGAVQCGYCTPGMLVTTMAFLKQNPAPTEREVREMLMGNLCRCTGYSRIVRAVMAAAKPLPPQASDHIERNS